MILFESPTFFRIFTFFLIFRHFVKQSYLGSIWSFWHHFQVKFSFFNFQTFVNKKKNCSTDMGGGYSLFPNIQLKFPLPDDVSVNIIVVLHTSLSYIPFIPLSQNPRYSFLIFSHFWSIMFFQNFNFGS